MGTKNGEWDGKGDAPSRDAAVAWLKTQGYTGTEAGELIPKGTSASRAGTKARLAFRARKAEKKGSGIPSVGDVAVGVARRLGNLDLDATKIPDVNPFGRNLSTTTKAKPKKKSATSTADLVNEAVAKADEDRFGSPGDLGRGAERGESLWPFPTQGMTDEEIAGITVLNKSTRKGSVNGVVPDAQGRVGARYSASSTLVPLKWSKERRADLQRVMHGLGLYGDDKLPLGSWDEKDSDAFAAVLQFSNVEGLSYIETLASWRQVGLPESLKAKLTAAKAEERVPFGPVVANPIDMRASLKVAATQVLGAGITDEQMNAISNAFQQQQIGAQRSAYNADEAGGTTTAAPDFGNFAQEQVRALDPVKADTRGAVKVASVIQQMLAGRMPTQQLPAEGG